jgi:VRR-NUC domain-containing protein
MDKNLKGGLFDGRGKPQPLELRAKAKKPKPTPEKTIQQKFIAWRNTHKNEFPILRCIYAVPNGIWTFKSVAGAMISQGLTAGIPDVNVDAPSHDGKYIGLKIEFKSEKGETSEEQKFFLGFFADLGYRTAICRTWYDAANIVNDHLGIKVPVYPK